MLEVKRSAIVVLAKQPFLDWLNFADPEGEYVTLEVLREDPNAYLISPCEGADELKQALEESATMIFEHELHDWITDDTLWPIDRSFDVFCRWFAVSFHSVVLDVTPQRLSATI